MTAAEGDRTLAAHGLGPRLRALRRERNFSLAQVAAATGVSMSFLSLVEAGKSDITLGRLLRLVEFYGIGIAELLPQAKRDHQIVVRRDEQRHISSSSEGLNAYLLSPDSNRVMMPSILVIAPGGASREHATHDGEEFVHVLEGRLTLELEGNGTLVLGEGDSAHFRAELAHLYRNESGSDTRLFLVVAPPRL